MEITSAEIGVSSHIAGESVVIEVKDNGIGVSPVMKELIFEKSVGKNTGLGLFLVRGILSITGMEITETGIEGEGARFEITRTAGKLAQSLFSITVLNLKREFFRLKTKLKKVFAANENV